MTCRSCIYGFVVFCCVAFCFVVLYCCFREGSCLRVLSGFGVPVGTGCAFCPVAVSWFVNNVPYLLKLCCLSLSAGVTFGATLGRTIAPFFGRIRPSLSTLLNLGSFGKFSKYIYFWNLEPYMLFSVRSTLGWSILLLLEDNCAFFWLHSSSRQKSDMPKKNALLAGHNCGEWG